MVDEDCILRGSANINSGGVISTDPSLTLQGLGNQVGSGEFVAEKLVVLGGYYGFQLNIKLKKGTVIYCGPGQTGTSYLVQLLVDSTEENVGKTG